MQKDLDLMICLCLVGDFFERILPWQLPVKSYLGNMFGIFSNQLHQIQDERIALRKRTEGEKLVQANGNLERGNFGLGIILLCSAQ